MSNSPAGAGVKIQLGRFATVSGLLGDSGICGRSVRRSSRFGSPSGVGTSSGADSGRINSICGAPTVGGTNEGTCPLGGTFEWQSLFGHFSGGQSPSNGSNEGQTSGVIMQGETIA